MVVLLLALILLALCGGKEIIKFRFGVALMLFGLAVTPHAHAAETSDFYAVTKPIVVCETKQDSQDEAMFASCKPHFAKPGDLYQLMFQAPEAVGAPGKLELSRFVPGNRNAGVVGFVSKAGFARAFKHVPPPSGCAGHANVVAGLECEDGL
jgi:hypothetical protein